jgi:hypothetical protein
MNNITTTDVWLCHTTKKINGKQIVVSCHLTYHTEMCFKTTGSAATGSSVAYGLTDEIDIIPTKLLPLFDGEHVDYLLYYFR